MSANGWTLGEFGDERLAKRGVCCFRGWWRGRAFAFAAWQVGGGVELLGFRGFSRTLG